MIVIHPKSFNSPGRTLVAIGQTKADADEFATCCRENGERVRVVSRSVSALNCTAVVWCVVRLERSPEA